MNTDIAQDIPFIPAPRITTVAGYLLTRLAQAGLISIFGVPGDYNLPILDAIAARPDLAWIGMATEQGAGYAADSYARQRGLGALVTTFGVGELSAMNAIAGAYAESVPVVHIVGTPALAARASSVTLHHNLPGRDYGHFARMAAEITAAQADLRAATAPEEIDRVLTAALRTSRPVYLTIPADVADLPVLAPAGPLPRADLPPLETAPDVRGGPLTQRSLWARVQDFLQPGDLLNNGGYTTERAIRQPDAGYHQIPAWDWTALPAAVGPDTSPAALRVITSHELAWALDAASSFVGAGRPVLIETVLDAGDAPPLLQDLTRALAAPANG